MLGWHMGRLRGGLGQFARDRERELLQFDRQVDRHGLDVTRIVTEKIARNAEKYPVAKSKGSARKYTELGS